MKIGILFGTAAAIFVITFAMRRRLLVVTISGPSMLPSYREGDRVLAVRRGPGSLRRGQVVVLDGPRPAVGRPGVTQKIIKRVVALAGQRVPNGMEGDIVPTGHIVVLGDNSAQSVDSRQLGFIPVSTVMATVVRKLVS